MVAYEKYNNGEMSDYIPTEIYEKLAKGVDTTHELVEQITVKTTELKELQNKQKSA